MSIIHSFCTITRLTIHLSRTTNTSIEPTSLLKKTERKKVIISLNELLRINEICREREGNEKAKGNNIPA